MKYALIGCGRIATNHIKAALNNGLAIVAVCDPDESHMEQLLKKHGLHTDIGIERYTDYKEMLEECGPDLVSIATESGVHACIAIDCIRKGVHVIIEKPMAMNLADAKRIIQMSAEHRVKVAVCHQNRFNRAVQAMRRALEARQELLRSGFVARYVGARRRRSDEPVHPRHRSFEMDAGG